MTDPVGCLVLGTAVGAFEPVFVGAGVGDVDGVVVVTILSAFVALKSHLLIVGPENVPHTAPSGAPHPGCGEQK